MFRTFALLLFLSHYSFGQYFNQSPYSYYHIGLITKDQNALQSALAGNGLAITDNLLINTKNPSAIGFEMSGTYFTELGFYMEKGILASKTSKTETAGGNLKQLQMLFKLKPNWGFLVELKPLSNISYRIISDKEYWDGFNYPVYYSGNGGVNALSLSNGISIKNKFGIGVKLSYLFGQSDKIEEIITTATTSDKLLSQENYRGFNYEIAALYKTKISSEVGLNISAKFTNQNNFSTIENLIFYKVVANVEDSITSVSRKQKKLATPSRTDLGITLQYRRLRFSVDFDKEVFTNLNLTEIQNLSYKNTNSWGFGFEILPKKNPKLYRETIAWRMGFKRSQLFLQIDNSNVPQQLLSGGATLPLQRSLGSVSLNYSYAIMGSKSQQLIQHSTNSISIDFSIRDWWGIRKKYD